MIKIKDFKMSENCDECRFRNFSLFQAQMTCKLTDEDVTNQ